MKENLHEGHRERMRAEFRKSGLPSEPHRQLEMLLFYVRKQVDTNKIAHRLIKRFGSLQGVLDAEPHELTEVEGVGNATAEFLRLIGAAAQICNAAPPAKTGLPLDTPERIEAFVRERLGRQRQECVLVAYLDAKRRLLYERLAKDTARSAIRVENSLRVTLTLALQHRAASILIGHNHPHGNPMPSQRDVAEANRLKAGLRAVGVDLADFVIVGEDLEIYSLARGGILT